MRASFSNERDGLYETMGGWIVDLQSMRDEYEIDLKALMVTICQRWRVVLLCAVLGAVLGIGFTVVRSVLVESPITEGLDKGAIIKVDQSVYGISPSDTSVLGKFRTAIANFEAAIQEAGEDESFLPIALQNKAVIDTMLQDIDALAEYIDNRLIFKINTTDAGVRLSTLLSLSGGDMSQVDADMMIQPYILYLSNDDTYDEIAQRWGTEPKYVRELVSLGTIVSQTDDSDQNITVLVDDSQAGGNAEGKLQYFSLQVRGEDEQRAQELLDYVLSSLDAYADEHAGAMLGRLRVVDVARTHAFDRSTIEGLADAEFSYAQLSTLLTYYRMFVESNQDIIESLIGDIEVPEVRLLASAEAIAPEEADALEAEEIAETKGSGKGLGLGKLLKSGLIGFFLGLFGCMVVYFAYFALTGTILSESEVDGMYHLRHLVTLTGEVSGRHRSKLDQWLRTRKEDVDYRSMDESQRYAVLERKVRGYCGDEASSFLLVGTNAIDPMDEIAHKLKLLMQDCTFATTTALNRDMRSLDALQGCDGVLLVVNVDHSRQAAVYKDLETIQYYGKELVGTVAVI